MEVVQFEQVCNINHKRAGYLLSYSASTEKLRLPSMSFKRWL